MAHEEVNEVILTKEEKIYNDLIRRGDDFFIFIQINIFFNIF